MTHLGNTSVSDTTTFRGIVRGKTIELDQELGLPEGQPVEITVQPIAAETTPGEGLSRAFGGWSEAAADLDEFLEWNRNQRKDREAIQAGLCDMVAGRLVSFDELDQRIRAKLGCEEPKR